MFLTQLNHLDDEGRARMVDVTGKSPSHRRAIATGQVNLKAETLDALRNKRLAKGEALAVARVAGISAAKETGRLIPLCHPLPLTSIAVNFQFPPCDEPGRAVIAIESEVKTFASTGVEMEALTAVSVSALTLYDMCKAIDKTIRIEQIYLLKKEGGSSDNRKTD